VLVFVSQVLQDPSSDQAFWNCQVLGIFLPEESRDNVSTKFGVLVCPSATSLVICWHGWLCVVFLLLNQSDFSCGLVDTTK